MGYYTAYSLTWEIKDKSKLDEYLTPSNYIKTHDELSFALSEDGSTSERSKWYEHERDMMEMSEAMPAYLFTLSGEGEEAEDLWRKYFINGKMQICKAEIVYPPFNPAQL